MFLWRISNHADLNGRGGLFASARWHTQGRAIVYLAESPSGALVEALLHLELDPSHLPKSYRLLKAQAPDGIAIQTVARTDLPNDWINNETATRTEGDDWLSSGSSALLRVPSVIVPETYNVLLSPEQPDAAKVKVLWQAEYPWDARLLRG